MWFLSWLVGSLKGGWLPRLALSCLSLFLLRKNCSEDTVILVKQCWQRDTNINSGTCPKTDWPTRMLVKCLDKQMASWQGGTTTTYITSILCPLAVKKQSLWQGHSLNAIYLPASMFHECFCQLFFLFQATLSACGYFQWQQSNTLQTKCSIKVFHKAAEHNILLLTFKWYIPPKMCHWNVENSQGVFWDEGVSVPGSWTNVASRPSWQQMTFFLILIWSTLVHQISSLSICASFVKRRALGAEEHR